MNLLSTIKKENFPDSWDLKNIGTILNNSQYGTNEASADDGNMEIVGMKDIQDGKILTDNLTKANLTDADREKYALNKEDILINRTNSYDLVGKVGLYNSDKIVGFASYLVRLSVDRKKADSVYINLWLNSYVAQGVIKRIATRAVSQANINPTEFKKFCPVPLPPLPEQKAIADFLSAWDEAIEKTQRLIQAREKWFRVLLRQLISDNGQLTTGNSSADDADSRRWKKVKLGDMFGKEIFINKGKALTKRNIQDGNIPVVAGGQTYAYFTNIATHEYPTITISASGAHAGFVWYHDYPIWASDCNVLFAYNGSTLFYYYALKILQHRIYALQSGGAQPHIYAKDLKNLYISNPSLEEQKQIAETLSTAQQGIDLLKQLAEKYKTQKRGLMQKLLTGDWRIKPEILNKYKEA